MRWALEAPGLRARDRLLLVCYAYHANRELLTWPSAATLVKRSGLDRKTVLAGTTRLQAIGALKDMGERRGHGVRMFCINVPEEVPKTAPVEPARTDPENGISTGTVFPTTDPENGISTGPENGIQKRCTTDLEVMKNRSARARVGLKTSKRKTSKVKHRGTNTTPSLPLPQADAWKTEEDRAVFEELGFE